MRAARHPGGTPHPGPASPAPVAPLGPAPRCTHTPGPALRTPGSCGTPGFCTPLPRGGTPGPAPLTPGSYGTPRSCTRHSAAPRTPGSCTPRHPRATPHTPGSSSPSIPHPGPGCTPQPASALSCNPQHGPCSLAGGSRSLSQAPPGLGDCRCCPAPAGRPRPLEPSPSGGDETWGRAGARLVGGRDARGAHLLRQ